ncbi:hypothetical protein IAT40_002445 [Kwoniella sp. CBS 6097]
MTDYVDLVGSFPQWHNELRQAGSSTVKRPQAKYLPAPRHGHTPDGYSWLAQLGAAELLGCPPRQYSPADMRTSIEGIFDYWNGKMFTLRQNPGACTQCIQDELEFNIKNIPLLPGAHVPPTDGAFVQTNAVLRPLSTNMTTYVHATEMKDALNRLDQMGAEQWKRGGKDVEREIEFIRELAEKIVQETRLTLRLYWASGPGRDLVQLSLSRTWQESTNISKDIQLHLTKSLEDIATESLYDATFAAFCLQPEERGKSYGPSDFTRLLAFEQACRTEKDLPAEYPFAIQMALGELTMALELLSELPPPPLIHPDIRHPKTYAVRLNIAQSAAIQLCTDQTLTTVMTDPSTAPECAPILWQRLQEIVGEFAGEFGLPLDLRERLFPFFSDEEQEARWQPRDEWGQALSENMAVPAEQRGGESGQRKGAQFVLGKQAYIFFTELMEEDAECVKPEELLKAYRSLGFICESLGGSFLRLVPPQNAGVPFIVRRPAPGTWQDPEGFEIPIVGMGEDMRLAYGWTKDWFALNDGETFDADEVDDEVDECRKGGFIFNAITGQVKRT